MHRAKALALAVLALVSLVAAPSAAGEVGSASVPDVVYDASAKSFTTAAKIAYQDTRDLVVTNLGTTAAVLWLCDSAVSPYKSAAVDPVSRSVTFTSVTFVNAGGWSIRETCAEGSKSLAGFGVGSRDYYDLVISFPKRSSNAVAWSGASEYLTILVLDRANGRVAVPGADIVLWKGTSAERVVRTDANGFWDTEEPLPGAGSFVVEAYKNTAGDPSYETFGKTTLQVQPRGLVVTRLSEAPLVGYATEVAYQVATGTSAEALLAGGSVGSYSLVFRQPDGSEVELRGAGAASREPLAVRPDGAVAATTRWAAGTYAMTLKVDAAGTVTNEPEWVQTWLLSADAASKHDLVATVSPASALAGLPTDLTVRVTRAGAPFAADVWLLGYEEAMSLHAGTLSLDSVPAERVIRAPQAAETGVYRFRTALELGEGPYVVHAREPNTPRHDNAGSEPAVVVEPASVTFTPGRLAFGLQHQVPVKVAVTGIDGAPLSGTLVVSSTDSTGSVDGLPTMLSVLDGVATFVADPGMKGRVVFDFAPTASNLGPQRADGALHVERPNIDVSPRAVRLGADAAVEVVVKDLAGQPLVGFTVEICGTPLAGCSPTETTDGEGRAVLHGAPIIPGTLALRVNGVETGETVEATSRVSPTIALGEPTIEKTAVKAGQAIVVRVPVTNTGDAAGLVTLALHVDGVQATQQTVEVPAGETRPVLLTAAIDQVGAHTLTVVAGTVQRAVSTVQVNSSEQPTEPSIPGFEAVAALGALAVAVVALRRR